MNRLIALAACAPLLLAACSIAARRFDRTYIEDGIRERTGHAPGPVRPRLDLSENPTEALDPGLPPGVDLADGLSEDEAVAAALWRNIGLAGRLEELGLARADLIQAGLLRNPAIEFIAPVNGEIELKTVFPIELTGAIFFRKMAASLELEARALLLIQAGIDVAAKARAGHAEVVAILGRLAETDEIVRLFGESARLTRARFAAGDVSQQTLTLVELDFLRAQRDRAQTKIAVQAARERLNLLLGFQPPRTTWQPAASANPTAPAPAPAAPPPESPLGRAREGTAGTDELVAFALEHRPDVRAAFLEAKAADKRVGLAGASVIPVVGGLIKAEAQHGDWSLGPGVAMDVPVFDFNQGGIARAKAGLGGAELHYLSLREQIAFEVRQANATLAGERGLEAFIRTELIPKSEEAVRGARRAFELGEESVLGLLVVQRGLVEARRDRADAELRLRLAQIELERCAGGWLLPNRANDTPLR